MAEGPAERPRARGLDEVHAVVLDLDGTVYLGNRLLPGAATFIETARGRGIPVRFVTNNPTRDPAQYARKLTELGVPTPVDDIVTTVVAMTGWLLDHAPGAAVYPIAEAPLVRALEGAGVHVTQDPALTDVVVASYDRGFDYGKLQAAFDAIWFHQRARLVATNPDPYCPLPSGRGEPDCAAIVAAIEACTGTTCEVTLGKPDPAMLDAALRGLDVPPHRALMIGDRLRTDIRMARRAGATSALVLTGDDGMDDVGAAAPEDRPDLVVDRLDSLLAPDGWPAGVDR
ncbi:HAD-IIA family hydrolase [Egibacter rhizosphaerae]|uniref:HAD-IIA family hydrolase n=1 Tax=Egibacter rhizosphaerae TaxID=1670831 RepID=A0A411YAX3_9ACTN|nr:HAD-IIA family hydrolase [Egibacter rhizosphaerae]QBI18329.1 HAD-IIA family hydrolase [Egibacter rhizosphaerae]